MKLNRRLTAFVLAAVLAVTGLSVAGFAADKAKEKTDHKVRILASASTVRVDKDISLDADVSSKAGDSYYGDYTWESDNEIVATVDSSGNVTGNYPGTAVITVRLDNGSSARRTITVTGTAKDYYYDYDNDRYYGYDYYRNPYYDPNSPYYTGSSSSKQSSSSRASSRDTVKLTDKASRETVVDKARSADGSTAVLKDYAYVSAESLQAAAKASSSPVAFDTTLNGSVVGRLVFQSGNASKYSGDIDTGVYSGTGNTSTVETKFNRAFANQTKVVLIDQKSFDAPVEVCVKADSLRTKDLVFYSYDKSTNIYKKISVSNAYKDSRDFLHFTTSRGGYIIASDGPLSST